MWSRVPCGPVPSPSEQAHSAGSLRRALFCPRGVVARPAPCACCLPGAAPSPLQAALWNPSSGVGAGIFVPPRWVCLAPARGPLGAPEAVRAPSLQLGSAVALTAFLLPCFVAGFVGGLISPPSRMIITGCEALTMALLAGRAWHASGRTVVVSAAAAGARWWWRRYRLCSFCGCLVGRAGRTPRAGRARPAAVCCRVACWGGSGQVCAAAARSACFGVGLARVWDGACLAPPPPRVICAALRQPARPSHGKSFPDDQFAGPVLTELQPQQPQQQPPPRSSRVASELQLHESVGRRATPTASAEPLSRNGPVI